MITLSSIVLAGDLDLNPTGDFENLGLISVPSLIKGGIAAVLVIASVAFFFMLALGGIRWITAGPDKAQTEAARSQIMSALIGLAIVFSAWAAVWLVNQLFEINIIELTIPSAHTGVGTT